MIAMGGVCPPQEPTYSYFLLINLDRRLALRYHPDKVNIAEVPDHESRVCFFRPNCTEEETRTRRKGVVHTTKPPAAQPRILRRSEKGNKRSSFRNKRPKDSGTDSFVDWNEREVHSGSPMTLLPLDYSLHKQPPFLCRHRSDGGWHAHFSFKHASEHACKDLAGLATLKLIVFSASYINAFVFFFVLVFLLLVPRYCCCLRGAE